MLKFSAKKVVFLVSSEKNQISSLLTPLWKNLGKIPWWCPLENTLPAPMTDNIAFHRSSAVSGGLALLRAFCQWNVEHQVSTALSFSFCTDVSRGCQPQTYPGGATDVSRGYRRIQGVTTDVSRGCQRGPAPPQISSISCHFVLWQAVSRTKHCCPLRSQSICAQKNFGLTTRDVVLTKRCGNAPKTPQNSQFGTALNSF